jgi:hypothetical protein
VSVSVPLATSFIRGCLLSVTYRKALPNMPEQDDTVAGELVQIQALSTVLARNLRVWMGFICGRFQFFDLGVECWPHRNRLQRERSALRLRMARWLAGLPHRQRRSMLRRVRAIHSM